MTLNKLTDNNGHINLLQNADVQYVDANQVLDSFARAIELAQARSGLLNDYALAVSNRVEGFSEIFTSGVVAAASVLSSGLAAEYLVAARAAQGVLGVTDYLGSIAVASITDARLSAGVAAIDSLLSGDDLAASITNIRDAGAIGGSEEPPGRRPRWRSLR